MYYAVWRRERIRQATNASANAKPSPARCGLPVVEQLHPELPTSDSTIVSQLGPE